MNLKPEELRENGYVLLDEMNHADIVPFVKKYMRKKTRSSSLYYASVIVSFFLVIFFCIKYYRSGACSIDKILIQIFLGILLTLALIPFHEWIHAIAYKSQGAKKTSFDANIKKFYFLAIADRFVADKREFQIVALAPFIIISIALIIASLMTGECWKISVFTTLLIHSFACSGDFALLSYFDAHRKKEVVTYDDKENKVSFFYGRENVDQLNQTA